MSERLEELELVNDIPEHVGAIVMACLQKDRTQRPQSMRVIREWIQSGEEVAVEPEKVSPTSARETQRLNPTPSPTTEKTPTGGSRKKWVYSIAAVVLAVVVGTAVILHEPGKSGSENESGEEGDSATQKVAAAENAAAEKAAAQKPATVLWEFETGGSVFSSPAIGSDGTVYVGSSDNKLYAINGKSGVKLWEFKTEGLETGGGVYSSPAIGPDGTVYVGSKD